jgi:hypothetical protein
MALKALWRRMRPGDRLVVGLLLGACGLLFVLLRPGAPGRKVMVERDGQVIFTAPLDRDRTVALKGPLGTTRLAIRDGTACIEESPCPRKVCIGMGRIARSGELLACVPNHLLVRVTGGPQEDDSAAPYDLLSR